MTDMEDQKMEGIPPYRMSMITRTAADVAERIVSGKYLYNPTYHECEIVIALVTEAVKKCKENQGG